MNQILLQQQPATAEKMGQQWVPHQHSAGLQRVPIANPFQYRSVVVGGFLEDGTSLIETRAKRNLRSWTEFCQEMVFAFELMTETEMARRQIIQLRHIGCVLGYIQKFCTLRYKILSMT